MRAVRVDKMTYAALEATLQEYAAGRAAETIPVARMLALGVAAIRQRAQALIDGLHGTVAGEIIGWILDGRRRERPRVSARDCAGRGEPHVDVGNAAGGTASPFDAARRRPHSGWSRRARSADGASRAGREVARDPQRGVVRAERLHDRPDRAGLRRDLLKREACGESEDHNGRQYPARRSENRENRIQRQLQDARRQDAEVEDGDRRQRQAGGRRGRDARPAPPPAPPSSTSSRRCADRRTPRRRSSARR